jgi:hypothetical protein
MSPEEKEDRRISRRKFVKGAAAAGVGAGVLAACGSTPAPQIVKETVEVEKIVRETVEVPVEVTKIVEVAAGEAQPEAAGPVTLEVFDPTGAIEVTVTHAPRLDTLEGKTICEVGDGLWEDDRTFPLIRELLQNAYPTATIIPYTRFPSGTENIDTDALQEAILAAGCDGAILGNAG